MGEGVELGDLENGGFGVAIELRRMSEGRINWPGGWRSCFCCSGSDRAEPVTGAAASAVASTGEGAFTVAGSGAGGVSNGGGERLKDFCSITGAC